MKRFILLLFVVPFWIISGCKKDDEAPPRNEDQEKRIQQIIPDEYLKVLKDLGMPIHEGTNPPDINGIYFVSPMILHKSNIKSGPPNHQFVDGRYSFSVHNKTDFSVKVISKHTSSTDSQSSFAAVSGSDNAFTVYSMETYTSGDGSTRFTYLYSGVMDGTAIKDFKQAFVNVEIIVDAPSLVRQGNARVVRDGDGISPRIPSWDAVGKAKPLKLNKNRNYLPV